VGASQEKNLTSHLGGRRETLRVGCRNSRCVCLSVGFPTAGGFWYSLSVDEGTPRVCQVGHEGLSYCRIGVDAPCSLSVHFYNPNEEPLTAHERKPYVFDDLREIV
jgi:hypothetical protein